MLMRRGVKYSSLLILEEKKKQIDLTSEIMREFSDIFIVVVNKNYIRLYIDKHYEDILKHCAKIDHDSTGQERLWQRGGIKNQSINTSINNYCYFNINVVSHGYIGLSTYYSIRYM